MRLRHKKPLNSYKGQTNNDKNEFNDDDFRQQTSPHKKAPNSNSEQIFKYARIMAKFVKTINQDCKSAQARTPSLTTHPLPQEPLQREKIEVQLERPQGLSARKEELKQQKQISKLQAKVEIKQENKGSKMPQRKKDAPPTPQTHRENRQMTAQNVRSQGFTTKLPESASKSKIQLKSKEVTKPPPKVVELDKPEGENKPSGTGPMTNNQATTSSSGVGTTPLYGLNMNQQPQQMQQQLGQPMGQSMAQNNGPNEQQMPNMGAMIGGMNNPMMNMNLMGNMSNMPAMNGMNGMNGMNPMNGMSMQQIEMLMRAFGPNMLMGGMPHMNMNMNNMMNMNMGANNQFNVQPPKASNQSSTNLFSEQLTTFKSNDTRRDVKTVYPLKRSAYHVAIAYKIYLDKLKKEGRSFDNLDDIDPTKSARRVKTNQGKGKEMAKKKR